MISRLISIWRRRGSRVEDRCVECPLSACRMGARAAVLKIDCEGMEARRLRHLGLYEGSCVTVIDRQDGCLLDVRGSRLALAASLAASITVMPLNS